jgi:hypothetical protein
MDFFLEHWRLIFYVVGGIFAAGGAWALLYYKERELGKNLAKLELESAAQDAATEQRLDMLSRDLADHKHETTDRLARIESKLDTLVKVLLPKE